MQCFVILYLQSIINILITAECKSVLLKLLYLWVLIFLQLLLTCVM